MHSEGSCVTRYALGDKVKITPASFSRIRDSSRSGVGYPVGRYLDVATAVMESGEVGVVKYLHPPGYEVTVEFASGVSLQVKDHWVERVL